MRTETAVSRSWPGVDRIAGLLPAHRRSRRILLASSAGVIQRIVQIASALIIVPLLLKALGPDRFGIWGAAASLAWLNGMLDLGFGPALITMVGEATACGRESEARRYITGALLMGIGMAVLTCAAGSAAVLIAAPGAQAGAYLIAVIGLAVNIPLNAGNAVWMALQKGHVAYLWELAQTLAILGASVAATSFTVDVRVYVAIAYGGIAIANIGSLVHLFICHPELRPDGWASPVHAAKVIGGKGLTYFAMGLIGGLTYMLDNVLALQLLGPQGSARMAVVWRICVTSGGFLTIISQPIWPAFGEAAARGDLQWIRRGLARGTALMIGVAAMEGALLVTAGGMLLRWWLRADLGLGPSVLWAAAVWIFAQASGRVPCYLLNAVGVIRFQIAMSAAATSIALVLKFVLAPRLGVAGILGPTAVAALSINFPLLVWRSRRWLSEQRDGCTHPAVCTEAAL